ncbi:hypothetical protein [Maricaulis sp.]|jgi:hypothetical protein|uniref:hypothetical protein n=1 Tax=Maricaulis sp. TaxID=1486257 RepID=UPI002632C584|nr:hypothetical protein [Maricaulis sp.]MDF1767400.1 hypothetical protein [Maricaulis sp.]
MFLTEVLGLSLLLHALSVGQSTAGCDAIPGAETLLDDAAGRPILLGETHGTKQAPEFVASLLCLGVARGERTILALEMSAMGQDRLAAYLDSDGDADAVQALTEDSYFWNGRMRDGRSSEAMLGLIDTVRLRRAAGAAIDVVALDYYPVDDADLAELPQRRDHAMLRRARSLVGSADVILVLVGNVHARRTPFVFGERSLDTIGSLAGPDEVYSVRLATIGGEAWTCRGATAETVECGPHASPAYVGLGERRVMSMEDAISAGVLGVEGDSYHRYVHLGESVASPPVVPLPE